MNILVYFLFVALSLGTKALYGHVYVIEIALILTILLFPLFSAKYKSNNKRNKRMVALDVFVMVYALLNIISIMVSLDSFFGSARHYRLMVLTPVLIYVVVRYIPASTDVLIRGLYSLVGATLAQSLSIVLHYSVHAKRAQYMEGATTGTITMSILICMSIAVLIYMRILAGSRPLKKLSMIAVAFLFVALIVNATRSAAIGIVILLPLANRMMRSRLLTIAIPGLLVLLLAVILIKNPYVVSRAHVEGEHEISTSIERLFTPKFYLRDLEGRLAFWSRIARQALERPLLGSGTASYGVGNKGGTSFHLGSAHNMLVSSLVTSGIPGLILLFMLIVGTYHCLNGTVGESDEVVALKTTLLVSFTILILVSVTNDLTGGRVFIFFFLMALAARLSLLEDEIPKSNEVSTKSTISRAA